MTPAAVPAGAIPPAEPAITAAEAEAFWEHGFLRVADVFTAAEVEQLAAHLDELITTWSVEAAWTGQWRRQLLSRDMAGKIQMRALHDLHLYSGAWLRAVDNPRLVSVLTALLGPDVELHHSTMHVKPPEIGSPFPMHQDQPFYEHEDERYIDVLVHLDDTFHENGEIRFLDGSHKRGPLPHTVLDDRTPCTPHLSPVDYRLEDTVAVPARAGDIVVFNINTIHGSYLNTTDRARRLVRMGYRHPDNRQIAGQSLGRPGLMVAGLRTRHAGEAAFSGHQ